MNEFDWAVITEITVCFRAGKDKNVSQRDILFAFVALCSFLDLSAAVSYQLASVTLPVLTYSHLTAGLITFNYSMAQILPLVALPALHVNILFEPVFSE